jgi:hypothetical protein
MILRRGIESLRARFQRARRESLNGWTASLLFHVLFMFLLSCFIFEAAVRDQVLTLDVERPESVASLELVAAVPELADPTLAADTNEQPVEISSMSPTDHDLVPVAELEPLEFESIVEMELDSETPSSIERGLRHRPERQLPWEIREPATTDSVRSAEGVAAALGPIEQAIRDELTQGDTLVRQSGRSVVS